jgi:hypothetical protein
VYHFKKVEISFSQTISNLHSRTGKYGDVVRGNIEQRQQVYSKESAIIGRNLVDALLL